ncbi:ionotropic receptor 21a-like [Chironomus tepperi]|uniref:ionotropic receptor 21a-like n=1 Tax=Chironomus tepperi TaxID=113505 RepID=UPI00391F86F1
MSGAMGMAQRRSTDLAMGNLNLKVDRTEIMDHSLGYTLETLVFMIPKGRPMSAFHKLLRPFDNFVWMSILFVIGVSTVIIACLSLLPRRVRNFVYGDRVTTPYMNLMIAIYGGAQTILPRYNFARSLLMMFLLFCLVLRSLYQGALFQYLQASDNEPEVQSIEEMVGRDFTFFTIPSYDDMLKNNTLTRNRRAIIQATDMKEVMDRTLNPYYAGCVMNSITEILYRNKLKARHREPLYTICKQSFTFIPITMWFPKNSYLIEPIDDKLLWYQCSGLIPFWASFEEDHKFLNPKPDPKAPTPLSLENFSATFQIWMYISALASAVFLLELFWHAVRRKFIKIKPKRRRVAKPMKMAKIKLKVIIPKKK